MIWTCVIRDMYCRKAENILGVGPLVACAPLIRIHKADKVDSHLQ